MKKQYFAWKDGKQNLNGKQEWQELTSKEFLELCYSNSKRPKEEKRYFARVPGVEDGDTYFVLECTYEEFLRSEAERKLRKRKRDEKEQLKADGLWYDLISLDYEVDDGDGNTVTLHDMVADENSVFETGLVELIDLESALKVLTSKERGIIDAFYLSENPKTEREYAKELNVPCMTLHCRKTKILKKLKNYFVQN